MTLVKRSNNLFPSMPSLLDRFFDGGLMDWNMSNFSTTDTTVPAVNVIENNDVFSIEVAAPGLKKEDFRIDYNNGQLTISSEHKNEMETKDGEKVTRREFSYQSFQRSFSVSENAIDVDNIVANYKDGILNITLPKREEAKPKPMKQIEIQ
jgi:HSP20 family protein